MASFHAKKKFGQHFLYDDRIAQRIVRLLPDNRVNVLEIGPGLGVLTKHLVQRRFEAFYLVEIDSEAVDYLNQELPELKNHLIKDDVLKLNWDKHFKSPLVVIGNFPYSISSPLIFKIIENRSLVQDVIGMFQLEVAQRLAAKPGNKTYGIPSVLAQAFYDIQLVFKVKPGSFRPPPKVFSAVIKMQRNNREKLSCDEELFTRIVRRTFQNRRKMLRNTIKSWLNDKNKKFIEHYLTLRPEQLSVDDFIYITKKLTQ